MDHERSRLTVWGFIKGLFKAVIGLSLLAQSLLFLFIMVAIIGIISEASRGAPEIEIEKNSALVLNPEGTLVEVSPPIELFESALANAIGGASDSQISVHDITRVIRAAAEDDRIDVLVLKLQDLYIPSIYASKAHYLAAEVEKFRETGKRVVAVGDYYTQEQYLIASEADTILMHDFGWIDMTGYGRYGNYYKSALDKLKVNANVFRVGTFKSAVEPFLRDDMSEEAKLANQAYLDVLWREYTSAVEENRNLSSGTVINLLNNVPGEIEAAGNDFALALVNAGLIDELMDKSAQTDVIVDIVGRDKDSKLGGFRGVGYETYKLAVPADEVRPKSPKVAIVTAAGVIVDGDSPYGVAAGETIARQLREARFNENVKAVVLRVDSPGGSAFASEVMRDELLQLKEAGKPVVVSMGSLAASGGYWISASADEIWAAPTTVTGSIGVFGYIPTFEDTLAEVGVYTDGVGTTPLSAIAAAGTGPLPEAYGQIIQASIEDIYDRFMGIVADGRGLTKERVNEIGQGRVWVGETALDIQLVDKLGTLDDAIESAAARAGLDDYDTIGMARAKTPFELFLEGLTGAETKVADDAAMANFGNIDMQNANVREIMQAVINEAQFFLGFNDPQGVYVRCLQCPQP